MPFVRRYPFVCYYILTILLASLSTLLSVVLVNPHDLATFWPQFWAWEAEQHRYPNLFTIGLYAVRKNADFALIFLYACAPSISAIAISALGWGREGLVRLISRFKPWLGAASSREAMKWYAVLFVAFVLGLALYVWTSYAYAPKAGIGAVPMTPALLTLGGSPLLIIWTVLIGSFIDEGGTGEELGWRGFALPIFESRLSSPLSAALLLGLFWWAFHLPREVMTFAAGGVNIVSWCEGQALFLWMLLAMTVVMTFFVNRTGGSILPSIMIHGGTNVWSKAAGMGMYHLLGFFDFRAIVMTIGAIVLLFAFGPNLGYLGRGREPVSPRPEVSGSAVVEG